MELTYEKKNALKGMSMHSPYETASTLDLYMTYKAYNVFLENK